MRKAVLVLALLAMGCDQPAKHSLASDEAASAPRAEAMMGGEKREANFAYTHNWSLEMPGPSVVPRYERARKLCLEDAAYKCSLLNSQLYQPSDSEQPVSALLVLRLPHDKIPAFENALLAPLEGEAQGDAMITSQRTDGEDLN